LFNKATEAGTSFHFKPEENAVTVTAFKETVSGEVALLFCAVHSTVHSKK
jgi:hypothetical protein